MELPEDAQASLPEGLFSLLREVFVVPAELKSDFLPKRVFL